MSTSRRQLLLSGLAATVGAACHAAPPGFGSAAQGRAVDALVHDPSLARTTRLKVLTWNTWMMPPWVRESPRNGPRAAAIAAELLTWDFDILCLEKVFDDGAREILRRALGARYPHQFGPANDWPSPEENSGVWVLSRLPLVNYAQIEFTDCGSIECLSRKGAILLTGAVARRPFHLVATHLQGEEGKAFTPKNDAVRARQVDQIAAQLVEPNLAPGVPFIICGDLGTRRHDGGSPAPSEVYLRLLQTLGAENGDEERITYDDTPANQLAKDPSGIQAELDYVLTRPNGCALEVKRSVHHLRRPGWDAPGDRVDLSYRYAVSAEIAFPSPEPTP